MTLQDLIDQLTEIKNSNPGYEKAKVCIYDLDTAISSSLELWLDKMHNELTITI